MNTVSIRFTTSKELKEQAEAAAEKLGSRLDVLMVEFLKQLTEKKAAKSVKYDEGNPTEYFKKSIKISEKELKEGKVSPLFDNAQDAIKWLNS